MKVTIGIIVIIVMIISVITGVILACCKVAGDYDDCSKKGR